MSGLIQLAAGLGAQFGLAGDQVKRLLSNTEILDSDMGRFVLSALKETGTNPSNADREYAERTAGGKKLSPEGLAAVIRAARADIINGLITHNRRADSYVNDVPRLEQAKLPIPELGNFLGKKPAGAQSLLDVGGYQMDPNTGLLMPHKPTVKPKGAVKYTPAELSRLKALGIEPLAE